MGRLFVCPAADWPELIGREDDSSLEQQGAEHSEKQPQAQTGEQTLKVHMLQMWVRGSTQFHRLIVGEIKTKIDHMWKIIRVFELYKKQIKQEKYFEKSNLYF